MVRQPRQKKAEIQRLSSISNLKTKQLSSSLISKGFQQEAERIEHYDIELRPTKLQEMKLGDGTGTSTQESMIANFLEAIAKVRQLTFSSDDDFVDRLSRRYTTVMLTLFAVIVSTKQYVGDPIACWTPAQFTGAHVEYTNYICWISNKYYVDFGSRLPGRDDTRNHKIAYYQWVPFILLGMTVFCYAPSLIWTFFAVDQGIDIGGMVRSLGTMDDLHWPTRVKTLRVVSQQLHNFLVSHNTDTPRTLNNNRWFNWRDQYLTEHASNIQHVPRYFAENDSYQRMRPRKRLLAFCLLVKLVYTLSAGLHVYVLEFFIGENGLPYGLQVLLRVLSGGDWSLNKRFPRVTYCDFTIRTMGDNLHKHTVQCVLPINLFNEKIFIIIWFWYALLAIMSLAGVVRLVWMSLPTSRQRFVKRLLVISAKTQHQTSRQAFEENMKTYFKGFVDDYLGMDGFLVIFLIARNTSDLLASEILDSLWQDFCTPHLVTSIKIEDEK